MKKMINLLLCLFLLSGQAAADVEENPKLTTKESTRALADKFMSSLQANDIRESFEIIRSYMPIPDLEFENMMVKTEENLVYIGPSLGKLIGYELLEENTIKDFMIRYTYVQKYEQHLLRWFFIFYKAQDEWLINVFYWDNKTQDFFNF